MAAAVPSGEVSRPTDGFGGAVLLVDFDVLFVGFLTSFIRSITNFYISSFISHSSQIVGRLRPKVRLRLQG
jgi:hypothetical protein